MLANLLEAAAPINPALERRGLARALREAIEAEFAGQFDRLEWRVDQELEASAPEEFTPIAAEVVYYAVVEAVRNAASHGRGSERDRRLGLVVTLRLGHGLWAIVEDDGVGLLLSRLLHVSPEAARRPPAEPAPTPAIGGRGLLFHSTMLAVLGGYLSVLSRPHGGCRVEIWLPESALRYPSRAAAGA